ncbi:hypothetical protein ALC62_01014 [Cyphomyrmex costatus]|uniref:Uncharacterized protein n=1 Tax=Cyphomyrmex costatus TaxID=456900 RepID=A0A151IPN8_9HYME|nr:hypothetical protein ALC62_01014 [Cyphomyrmex costatus]
MVCLSFVDHICQQVLQQNRVEDINKEATSFKVVNIDDAGAGTSNKIDEHPNKSDDSCTMIDGKTSNVITNQKSSNSCNICGARPTQMNKLDIISTLPRKTEFYKKYVNNKAQ